MAKPKLITAEEREAADDVDMGALNPITVGDTDSELAWDEWIDALKNSDATGTIRAHRLPVDADGNPMLGKGSRQIYLGSWPHQLYAFDDLLAKLTKEFLKPGETAHIKLTGTTPGHRGVMFSRIVTLQKADAPVDNGSTGSETVGQLFKLLQESQDRQLTTVQQLMTSAPAPTAPGRGGMEIVKDIFAIITPLAAPVIAAYIARPPAPKSDLGELLNAMMQMKDFISGTTSNDSEDSTTVGIIKAVAPALPQLLQLLSQNQQPHAPVVRRQLPRPTVDPSRPSSMVSSPSPPLVTPPVGASEIDPVLAQLKPQLDQLAQLAEQQADPAEVAKLTVSMLPEGFVEQLANIVQDPQAFSRLSLLSPDLKKHGVWFESLRVALEAELFEDEGNAQNS